MEDSDANSDVVGIHIVFPMGKRMEVQNTVVEAGRDVDRRILQVEAVTVCCRCDIDGNRIAVDGLRTCPD